jgi:DNA-binding response OmpR family regulator
MASKQRVLVIDHDDDTRDMVRQSLADKYEVIETGDSRQALSMTLERDPGAILLELSLTTFSGFELLKTLSSLSFTQRIPILVLSAEDPRNKAFCLSLGASDYFQKPIEAAQLRTRLTAALSEREKKVERRAAPRVNTKLPVKLKWTDKSGTARETRTVTENISATGFLCGCKIPLEVGTSLDVFVGADWEHYMGAASVVRVQGADTENPFYGCHFTRKA